MNHITTDFLVPSKATLGNQKGQVALEFILVISFALGLIFLFFQQAFNATDGYIVHYANFMSSRAYLTSDNGSNTVGGAIGYAQRIATEVYESYPLRNFNIQTDFKVNTHLNSGALFSGTVASFEKESSFFAGMGSGDKAKLVSESFLGKEPTRVNCHEVICEAITGSRQSCEGGADSLDITLYDNGC